MKTEVVTDLDHLAAYLPQTASVVHSKVLGLASPGLQMFVSDGNRSWEIALGEIGPGRRLRPDHVFSVWCLTKPIVALGVLALGHLGKLDLRTPMNKLPGLEECGAEVTVQDVLDHRAGMSAPRLMEVYLATRRKQVELLRRSWRSATTRAEYSEFSGWSLLEWAIDTVIETSPSEFLVRLASRHEYGTELFFDLDSEQLRARRESIGLYAAGYPASWWPVLQDRAVSGTSGHRVALGGFTSMRFIGNLFRELAQPALSGRSYGLLTACSEQILEGATTSFRQDPVLGRPIAMRNGFWTNARHAGFGECYSERTFGHMGWMGTSVALSDPESGVTVAAIMNTMPATPGRVDQGRESLLLAVAQDLT